MLYDDRGENGPSELKNEDELQEYFVAQIFSEHCRLCIGLMIMQLSIRLNQTRCHWKTVKSFSFNFLQITLTRPRLITTSDPDYMVCN